MAFNHNSNLLITGGADGMIRLFGRLHVLCTLCVCVCACVCVCVCVCVANRLLDLMAISYAPFLP